MDARAPRGQRRWRERAEGRFGGRIRRLRVVWTSDLELFNEAEDASAISDAELDSKFTALAGRDGEPWRRWLDSLERQEVVRRLPAF